MKRAIALFFAVFVINAQRVLAYEVPNHADISQTALTRSVLGQEIGPTRKLFRIGLRAVDVDNPSQLFPLPVALPPIPMCFGVTRDANGAMVPNPNTQPPWNTDAGRTPLSIVNLLRYGACYEDNAEVGDLRPLAHFYDPQQNGQGLVAGPSSPDWTLVRGSGSALTGVNHYTWQDARDAMHEALTRSSGLASVSAADNDILRKLAWAKTFQALGHLVHHLQDMAQPQHVRNDDHCDALPCRAGVFKPSGYEKHLLNNRLEFVQQLAATAGAPMMFGLPREFWNATVPTGQPLTGAPNLQGHMPSSLGIAAYTSTNFVSAGTDFVGGTTDGVTVWGQRADHPYPQAASELRQVSLAELFANADPSTLTGVARDLCGGNAATCYMQFVGTQADPQARTSALSTFGQALLRPAGAFSPPNISGGIGIFQQNFFTYDDAARKLVPRSVEYSAGLINYFFRGEMKIDLPREGVYAIVDHSIEKNAGSDGFRDITLSVTNTTADIVTARGSGTQFAQVRVPQDMRGGSFVAVAKFHRNTCYTSDLSGQINASMTTTQAMACRSAVEEIVVSDPVVQGPNDVLAAGSKQDFSFHFANAIPIEATDLYLQVVFKGTLGEEQGAVAVTTKDISEPTFFGYANMRDYQVCLADQTSPCRSDWPPNTLARDLSIAPASIPTEADFANTAPAGAYSANRPYSATTRSFASLDWIGFSREHPSYKVGRLPANGIPPGKYVRLALLGDIDQPAGPWPNHLDRAYYTGNKTFSLVNSGTGLGNAGTYEDPKVNYMAMANLAKNDVPFLALARPGCGIVENPDGAVLGETGTSGQGSGVVTREAYEGLFFEISRLRLAEVQANADDVLDSATLPRYHRFRGATLGIRVDRQDQVKAYGFIAANPLGDEGADQWTAYQNGVSTGFVTNAGLIEYSAIHRFSDEMLSLGLNTGTPLQLVPSGPVGFSVASRLQFASRYLEERQAVMPNGIESGCFTADRAGSSGRGWLAKNFLTHPALAYKPMWGRYAGWE